MVADSLKDGATLLTGGTAPDSESLSEVRVSDV